MKRMRSVVWLMLAVSLLFNVFFLAGYLQARAVSAAASDPNGAVVERVADELGLNDAQTDLFAQLRSSMREGDRVFEQSIALVRQELNDELSRSDPDTARIRELIDREAELQRDRRMAGLRRFSEFASVLSPEQRERMSSELCRKRDRPGRRDRHEMLLKRFDANGDGELDEAERASAREAFEAHRREREQQWQSEMLQRFDADGDGELDDEEQAARRQWYRENGQRRGRGDRDGRRGRR